MSFNIVFYRNNSPLNKINKSLTPVTTIVGNLKEGTSIVDPHIIIEGPLINANYAYIAEFGRYYYLTDAPTQYNNFWEYQFHSDGLYTAREAILNAPVIVSKSSSNWNLYLNDDRYKCYQNPIEVLKQFPSGFNHDEYSFVLALQGIFTPST